MFLSIGSWQWVGMQDRFFYTLKTLQKQEVKEYCWSNDCSKYYQVLCYLITDKANYVCGEFLSMLLIVMGFST